MANINPPPAPAVKLIGTHAVDRPATTVASGLDHWIDGTFGTVEIEDEVVALSPNGRRIAVHSSPGGTRDHAGPIDAFQRLVDPSVAIAGLPNAVVHASGGPAMYDHASRRIAVVYHAEEHLDGDPTSYRSFLGLASSGDRGRTFEDHGPILASWVPDVDWRRTGGCIEVGPGPFVERDDEILLLFQDKSPFHRLNLGLARTDADDARTGIARRTPWNLRKHGPGGAKSRGLGGDADDIYPATSRERRIEWFDIALAADGRLLIVYSSSDRGWWNLHVAASSDAITWSEPVAVFDRWTPDELLYVTFCSRDPAAQRQLSGDEVDLVCVRSNTGGFGRWRDARLERIALSVR